MRRAIVFLAALLFVSAPSRADTPQQVQAKIDECLEKMKSDTPHTRVDGCLALPFGEEAAKAAIPAIIALLDDPEPQVRMRALQSLAGFGPAALPALPKFQKMIVEKDRALLFGNLDQYAAGASFTIENLSKVGPEALPLISAIALKGRVITDKDIANYQSLKPAPVPPKGGQGHVPPRDEREHVVRLSACRAIGVLKDPKGLPVLLAILPLADKVAERPQHNPNNDMVCTILIAIGNLAVDDPKAIAVLKSHEKSYGDQCDTAIRRINQAKEAGK